MTRNAVALRGVDSTAGRARIDAAHRLRNDRRHPQLASQASMTFARSIKCLLLLAAAGLPFAASAAQGRLGLSVSVETDGFFSKTLKQVKITAVTHGAPAEQAGLQAGDDVEAINDTPIAGASGPAIMDIVHGVKPGDHLRMKVKRGGAEKVIDIVAGPAAE